MKLNENEGGKLVYKFYAIHQANFEREIEKSDTHKYKRQIGFAKCLHGYIESIHTNDKPLDARKCGIATVLTQLCLMDPKINRKGSGNMGERQLQILEDKGELELRIPETLPESVLEDCKEIVSLRMSARPMEGAFAYFSAAKNLDFEKLIVTYGINIFAIYDTQTASRNYDAKTGYIGSCCENRICTRAFSAFWIFCKVKRF